MLSSKKQYFAVHAGDLCQNYGLFKLLKLLIKIATKKGRYRDGFIYPKSNQGA